MLDLAGKDAHFVTYGAMAKEELSFHPSAFIFSNLTAHGFWQPEWYKQKSPEERARVTGELVKYMAVGKVRIVPSRIHWLRALRIEQFKEPNHEIVKIDGRVSDEGATKIVRGVMGKLSGGFGGKKILLQVDPV
jgi:NADPH:quinone reductase-like Zn-dependent oxidoreductase